MSDLHPSFIWRHRQYAPILGASELRLNMESACRIGLIESAETMWSELAFYRETADRIIGEYRCHTRSLRASFWMYPEVFADHDLNICTLETGMATYP